jgi:hypothetical protein|tara:strand:+ start:4406 stop:4783 length:378 start_codon:yes stop_codon:yes gene_type:complete
VKSETIFWKLVKQKTPKIKWTRLESWSSFGVPDLLGYNDKCGFLMCELKVTKGHKVYFSPHQLLFHQTHTKRNFILLQTLDPLSVKLYESKEVLRIKSDHREARCLALDDWDHIQRLLLDDSLDA